MLKIYLTIGAIWVVYLSIRCIISEKLNQKSLNKLALIDVFSGIILWPINIPIYLYLNWIANDSVQDYYRDLQFEDEDEDSE